MRAWETPVIIKKWLCIYSKDILNLAHAHVIEFVIKLLVSPELGRYRPSPTPLQVNLLLSVQYLSLQNYRFSGFSAEQALVLPLSAGLDLACYCSAIFSIKMIHLAAAANFLFQ